MVERCIRPHQEVSIAEGWSVWRQEGEAGAEREGGENKIKLFLPRICSKPTREEKKRAEKTTTKKKEANAPAKVAKATNSKANKETEAKLSATNWNWNWSWNNFVENSFFVVFAMRECISTTHFRASFELLFLSPVLFLWQSLWYPKNYSIACLYIRIKYYITIIYCTL